jgi:hypothetical protein
LTVQITFPEIFGPGIFVISEVVDVKLDSEEVLEEIVSMA